MNRAPAFLLSLTLSLVLHTCIFLTGYFSIRTPQKNVPIETSLYVELKTPPLNVKASLPQPVAKRQSSNGARLTVKALTPSFRPSLHSKISNDLAHTVTSDGVDGAVDANIRARPFDSPQSYGLSGAEYDEGNAVFGFLEALYNRVNELLIYDSILAQYGHKGVVYIEFDVDQRGKIIERTLRSKADDPILKVHVLRSAVLPALREPLQESLWVKTQQPIRLRARFEFLQGDRRSNLFDHDPERIAGLAFTFRRFTGERKVAKSLGRHLMNGGIDYDLFALYEAWQKYSKANERRRLEVDPFAEYRADPYY